MTKPPANTAQHRTLALLRVAASRIERDARSVESALDRGNCVHARHFDSKMREDVGRVLGALGVLTPGHPGEHYTRFVRPGPVRPRLASLPGVLISARDEGRGMASIDTANRLHDRVDRVCKLR